MYGGVRFGGTITIDSAFALGFDHIALCAGAGRPTVIPMTNGLARGVRQASDFLMALQLTGAAKTDSIANLTVRLPIVVIGGGLTAIDTATESLAYYPVQVEKFLSRYETLVAERGEAAVRGAVERGRARGRRRIHRPCAARSAPSARPPPRGPRAASRRADRRLGRRHDRLSPPADRRAELHAQPRGSGEGDGGGHPLRRMADPGEVEIDRFGQAAALRLTRHRAAEVGGHRPEPEQGPGEEVVLPARTILVAAGTQPNTVLAARTRTHVTLDGRYFQALDEDGNPVDAASASPSPRRCGC